MKLSITPTLLNSYDWLLNCLPSWREKAFNDLEATLRRWPKTYGDEAKKGVEFEDAIQKVCEQNRHSEVKASDEFKYIAQRCVGGKFQQWCEFMFEHEGAQVRAFGKIDVQLQDRIIDLKTTKKYKGPQQYTKGWQPPIYLLATKAPLFEFVIAEWVSEKSSKIAGVHEVEVPFRESMLQEVTDHYGSFVAFLREKNLYDAYIYDYCKNPRP